MYSATRYLIRMIGRIIWKMKSFLIILGAFVLQTTMSLMAFDPGLNFYVYWGAAYNLVFADFDNYDTHGEHGERLFFLLVTLAITLVLLNLLIAIISDEYDHVQNTKESQDVLERLILIREVSKYLKFGYGDSLDK